ncbi:MFS transporter [Alcanivorax sediminis]|uniref:MFS transporter n=1 Tax=Alcanivorax sediminis TaxID=2663008 RepID=A0A6N7LQS9_9GAMM|nr:MFS transporter [Alcanivorax sediminis]MQX52412.1 MFS transporter [Alcanivorax sediminis]
MAKQELLDKLYAQVANDEDARTCTDISEEACREVPGNFFRIITANALTKIGDLLINPKTVLAWLVTAVGAPAWLAGFLVPIRESGSLIPQLMIGALVRRHPVRKGFWVLGSALQGLAVLGMALAVWWLEGMQAGMAIIALLILFSISRGFCSVAMKDVQGKCIPKSRRGRLTGLSATLSGAITFALSLIIFQGEGDPTRAFYTALLTGAGMAWLLAAWVFFTVDEAPGASEGGHNAFRQALTSLGLLKTDRPFRRFVMTRALLMSSSLASPFLVLLAQDQSSLPLLLGSFVLASSLASTVSATVWGYMADTSSRNVMIRGGGLAAFVCMLAGGFALWGPTVSWLHWLFPVAYFVLAIAHAGIRIGRKTYLVDMAGGTKRTDYTSVSNTVIGVLLLAVGGLSAVVSTFGNDWALLVLGVMGAVGVLSAMLLEEV